MKKIWPILLVVAAFLVSYGLWNLAVSNQRASPYEVLSIAVEHNGPMTVVRPLPDGTGSEVITVYLYASGRYVRGSIEFLSTELHPISDVKHWIQWKRTVTTNQGDILHQDYWTGNPAEIETIIVFRGSYKPDTDAKNIVDVRQANEADGESARFLLDGYLALLRQKYPSLAQTK